MIITILNKNSLPFVGDFDDLNFSNSLLIANDLRTPSTFDDDNLLVQLDDNLDGEIIFSFMNNNFFIKNLKSIKKQSKCLPSFQI